MFKTNFSRHNKILGPQKSGVLPPNALLGYGLACKAKVSHLDENIPTLCFWLNSSKIRLLPNQCIQHKLWRSEDGATCKQNGHR